MKGSGRGARNTQEPKELVVFSILRASACSECGEELWKGSFLTMEKGKPLCLRCADLDHLEYLPRGDAALTSRSRKYSRLSAVVVRFSRTRGRYERQGLLVESAALEKAEQECLDDEERRAIARERAAARRELADERYVRQFSEHILSRYPGCPAEEAGRIAEHACRKYSGRTGRSAAAKEFDAEAIDLAVKARVRHNHTNYDQLLAQGWDRSEAREKVAPQVMDMIIRWRGDLDS